MSILIRTLMGFMITPFTGRLRPFSSTVPDMGPGVGAWASKDMDAPDASRTPPPAPLPYPLWDDRLDATFGAQAPVRRPYALILLGLISIILLAVLVGVLFKKDQPAVHAAQVQQAQELELKHLRGEAEKGDATAQYLLGLRYWERRDYKSGMLWLQQAANAHLAEAEYALGTKYLEGSGVLQHYETAIEYITRAAQDGYLEAQYKLGLLYSTGTVVAGNREAAYVWLNIAASRGHEEAKLARERVEVGMPLDTLKRAQNLSADKISHMATPASPR